jgi:hypothetical protein
VALLSWVFYSHIVIGLWCWTVLKRIIEVSVGGCFTKSTPLFVNVELLTIEGLVQNLSGYRRRVLLAKYYLLSRVQV